MAKLMDKSELSALITQIGKSSGEVDMMIQTAAVAGIAYSIVDRNTTPANDLLLRVNKHSKAALVAYLEKFGAFAWSKDEDKLMFYEREGVAWNDEYEQQVRATMWLNAKKPPVPVSLYDAPVEISRLIDRLRAKKRKGAQIKGIEVLDAVEAAYNSANGTFLLKQMTPDKEVIEAADDAQKRADAKKAEESKPAPVPTGTTATNEQLAALIGHFNGLATDLKKAA